MSRRVDFSADLILVCNSLDAGGIERVVSTLANEWSRRGRRVSVVMQYDRQRFYALDPSIHHVVLGNSGLARLVGYTKKVRRRLLESKLAKRWLLGLLGGGLYKSSVESFHHINFGLMIAFESWTLRRALKRIESPVVVSFGTALNILTLKACEGLGRRVVISERSDAGLNGWGRLSRRFYNRADIVTANSRGTLRSLADFVDQGKLAFVPNPLVLPNGGGGGKTPPPAPFFLSVGRLVWDKAYDVLLEAFALAGDELGVWRLSVVGDGILKDSLTAQADGLGIAGRVDWHGIVQDPHAFYRAASIFALPSRVEGMPNALLEAMSCGLAVVVSDGAPGPLELVEDGVTGLVVPVNDSAALASALSRLANDEALRRRLGEAARERVSEYKLPRAVAAWESVVGLTRRDASDGETLRAPVRLDAR